MPWRRYVSDDHSLTVEFYLSDDGPWYLRPRENGEKINWMSGTYDTEALLDSPSLAERALDALARDWIVHGVTPVTGELHSTGLPLSGVAPHLRGYYGG